MKPDIYIKVRFRTNLEGGRKTSLKRKGTLATDFYACPMIIDNKMYDCRLLIENKEILLGIYYELPVIFLNRDLTLQNLSIGKNITLWEGKEIADGQVTRICHLEF